MITDAAIPEGYGSITPYFTVADADLLMRFLVGAFDAVRLKETRHSDGTVQHARLRIGTSVIMLNQAGGDYGANTSQMHLYVGDADAAFRRALDHGATGVMEPNLRPHGDRMAGIKDPCGNTWWLATPAG